MPPNDLSGLTALAAAFAQHGLAAFSVGGADGWTLTDWFENIYIRTAGPRRYDELTGHRIDWTDPSVRAALRTMSQLLTPATMTGGTDNALHTNFEGSVRAASSPSPAAAMVFEGDFVAGLLGGAGAQIGVDIDVFPFPGTSGSAPTVIGGGDAAVCCAARAPGPNCSASLPDTRRGDLGFALVVSCRRTSTSI